MRLSRENIWKCHEIINDNDFCIEKEIERNNK